MIREPSFADDEFDDDDEGHQNFREAVDAVIASGNKLLESKEQANPWNMASGLLSGAVHFWLFSRQPCANPDCEPCSAMNTAERRMTQLIKEISAHSKDSEYFHSPNDHNVGSA